MAALVLSCSHGGGGPVRREAGSDAALAIWVSPVVRWRPGERRELPFAIENTSNRTVVLGAPDPAMARVDVYVGPEDDRVCGTAPPADAVEAGPAVALAPGDRIAVRVDLHAACRGVPAGEYRFAVTYRAPRVKGSKLWTGALQARYGVLLVEHGTAAAPTPGLRSPRPERQRVETDREPRTPPR